MSASTCSGSGGPLDADLCCQPCVSRLGRVAEDLRPEPVTPIAGQRDLFGGEVPGAE